MICNEISNEKRLPAKACARLLCLREPQGTCAQGSVYPTNAGVIENHVEGFGKSTFALRVATAHASATTCQHHAVTLMASVEERNMFLLGAEYF